MTKAEKNKRVLKRCRRSIKTIIQLTDRREVLAARLEARPMDIRPERIQVSPSDRYTEYMCELADIDLMIDRERARFRLRKMAALDVIRCCPNVRHRLMATYYYTEYAINDNRITLFTYDDMVLFFKASKRDIYAGLRSVIEG